MVTFMKTEDPSKMSQHDFAHFGLTDIVYVKEKTDGTGYEVHAADGNQIGEAETYQAAQMVALQNNMIPLTTQ